MKFGAIPIDEGEGAILAHSLRLSSGTLRKGRVLVAGDIERLRSEGLDSVTVARLEPGDLDENRAASLIASALSSPGLVPSGASTGRVHFTAEAPGVFVIDSARFGRMNGVDECLAFATVPRYEILKKGQVAATIKVITLGVPEKLVARCVEIAKSDPPAMALKPFLDRKIGFLQTTLPGLPPRILEKARATMVPRLADIGCRIDEELHRPHALAEVLDGLQQIIRARCDIVLVICATAVVDRRDILPQAVIAAGGEILRLGIPVDPGHLTLMARIGDTVVLGLPGSARSPRLHGFDGILRRLVAGIEVSPGDLTDMGVGGLLRDSPAKQKPVSIHSDPIERRVGGIVLAAGQSRRMGVVNKMLAEVDGEPMVRHAVRAVTRSRAAPVVVVLGHEHERVKEALRGENVRFAYNPDHAQGMSTSLRTGLTALPQELSAVVVALGDMPGIEPNDVDALIEAFDPARDAAICVPTHRGTRGNPVLLDRRFFGDMDALTGDVGARHLIQENQSLVAEIPSSNPGVLLDLDTPEALAEAQGQPSHHVGKERPVQKDLRGK